MRFPDGYIGTKSMGGIPLWSRGVLVGIVLIFSTSCIYDEVTIRSNPSLEIRTNEPKRNGVIYLQVSDERPSSLVGIRPAEITAGPSIITGIHDAISKALATKGFVTTNQKRDAAAELRVDLVDLSLTWRLASPLETRTETKAVVDAECFSEQSQRFVSKYTGNAKEANMNMHSDDNINKIINDAVTRALQSLIEDPDLDACLSGLKGNALAARSQRFGEVR